MRSHDFENGAVSPFKLSLWKSKNSTLFSHSFQVFPSNKKVAIWSRWDRHTHLLSLINLNIKELFVFCILNWLLSFEILLLISLYIFVDKFSFTWILTIAFSKTFSGWWFEVDFVIVFKKFKVLSSSSVLLDGPDITGSCWGEWMVKMPK